MQYKKRIADKLLADRLARKGAVLIQGAKWCGKTTTAEQVAASILYMNDPQRINQNISLAEINPQLLLQGKNPRLIDEWQLAPSLWDSIRFEVDHRNEHGLFILTGSAVPPQGETKHSGTGRFSWITMRPMSLWESQESDGSVSLADLFNQPAQIAGINKLSLQDIAFVTCRGGWPESTDMTGTDALEQAFDYYEAVVNKDISRADGVQRDSERAKRLMRSYARYQGAMAATTAIRNDMKVNDTDSLDEETVASYINALKEIFVIEDMRAWNPNLRSKTAIRTSDNRYFADPSIAVAALGIGPNDLINDLETFGLMFETLCVRDLRVYADVLNGEVYHYRDKDGLECDAVIHLRNGQYGLIEIKLGGHTKIEEGVKTLNELEKKIDTTRMKSPSFKMVLTGTESYAYRRKDGVYVVPIGCLRS